MPEFRRNRGGKRKKARSVKVLASEVAGTQRNLAALLAMSKDCPPDKLQAGVVEAARQLPSADAIVMAEMTLPNQHAYLLVMRTIAQRAMAAIAPRVVWKLARKIEDHQEPGDTRLIAEYLKGTGLLEPSTPQTDEEREAKMVRHAKLEKRTLADLKAMVLADKVA